MFFDDLSQLYHYHFGKQFMGKWLLQKSQWDKSWNNFTNIKHSILGKKLKLLFVFFYTENIDISKRYP